MIPPIIASVLVGAALAALLLAAAVDIRDRIIPNGLVLVVAVAALGARVVGAAESPLWASLAVSFVTLAALGTLAAKDLIGWGDVKMIAAVTLLVPIRGVIPLVLAITLAGGILGCFYLGASLLLRRKPEPAPMLAPGVGSVGRVGRLVAKERRRIVAREPMPYGLAIAGGTACYLADEMLSCWHATRCLF